VTEWSQAAAEQRTEIITSVVAGRSEHGRVCPDWDRVIGDIEDYVPGLDLAPPYDRPTLIVAKRIYRELHNQYRASQKGTRS
jgi:hypothetical protein